MGIRRLVVISYNGLMPSLKEYSLLDSDIVFLNHGSFGATPKPVFRESQRWQSELENQPVEFLGRRHNSLMENAVIFLVDGIIQKARDAGIMTIIDGTHAPGKIPLRLDALGADFYGRNLHNLHFPVYFAPNITQDS